MEEVRDGNVEKLAILFERYHVMLYNFFLRLTGNRSISEDLVQDVFIRILKYRSSYKGQDKFIIWLYRIARNTHIDHLRKRKDEVSLGEQWDEVPSQELSPPKKVEQAQEWDEVPSQELSPPEKVEQAQEIVRLGLALAKLPLKKREVLILSRFQNLKYKEIAELLGCQIGTVKANIHRATKELGKAYFELSGGITS
jgi:RNA polymerase sigma-70 factor (ECF subfamily)